MILIDSGTAFQVNQQPRNNPIQRPVISHLTSYRSLPGRDSTGKQDISQINSTLVHIYEVNIFLSCKIFAYMVGVASDFLV